MAVAKRTYGVRKCAAEVCHFYVQEVRATMCGVPVVERPHEFDGLEYWHCHPACVEIQTFKLLESVVTCAACREGVRRQPELLRQETAQFTFKELLARIEPEYRSRYRAYMERGFLPGPSLQADLAETACTAAILQTAFDTEIAAEYARADAEIAKASRAMSNLDEQKELLKLFCTDVSAELLVIAAGATA